MLMEAATKILPLEWAFFELSARFMERNWHTSKNHFALANLQYDCVNKMLTQDTTRPYRVNKKQTHLCLLFGFLHRTQLNVNSRSHKVNRTKTLHTSQIIFVQHHFYYTKPLMHVISCIPHVNTTMTSP